MGAAIEAIIYIVMLQIKAVIWIFRMLFGFIGFINRGGSLLPKDFAPDLQTRFEHTHIVAGSGFGKTQILQNLILQDLTKIPT